MTAMILVNKNYLSIYLPGILWQWYTQKHNVPQTRPDPEGV